MSLPTIDEAFKDIDDGKYYCWYSLSFNAMSQGDDSNPIWIYLTLDRAVAQGGVNNAKIKDVRANLLRLGLTRLGPARFTTPKSYPPIARIKGRGRRKTDQ